MQALQMTLTKVEPKLPISELPSYLRNGAVDHPFRCAVQAPSEYRPNAFPHGELTRVVDLMKHNFQVNLDFKTGELFYELTTSTSAFTAYKQLENAYQFFLLVCRAVNDGSKTTEA